VDHKVEVSLGQAVEARFGAGPGYFKGTVKAMSSHPDGSLYDIEYEDGDTETAVPRFRIRHFGDDKPETLEVRATCKH
jgi:hypothetical protein